MKEKIPEVSDKKLNELIKRIKPLVRFELADWMDVKPKCDNRGVPVRARSNSRYWALFEIEPVHPRKIAYTWEPKPIGGPRHDIACFDAIRTYHKYGAPSLFKPSIAEVIAQIPEDVVDKTVAFEIIDYYDLDCTHCIDPYHVVLTRLFMNRIQWEEETFTWRKNDVEER